MLTFLRKIRKSFIESGSAQKYFIYAIGEIFLVVIGILIALQINNWNEERKLRNLEQSYLRALHKEFTINHNRINQLIEQTDQSLTNANELIKLTGPKPTSITNEEFSKLFIGTTLVELKYRPSTGVLKEIINSGRLEIFKNEQLRAQFASWESQLERIVFQEDVEHGRIRLQLIDFFSEEGNWRKILIDQMGGHFEIDQTQFEPKNFEVLQSEQFENLLVGFIATGTFLNQSYYVPLKKQVEYILNAIDAELKN